MIHKAIEIGYPILRIKNTFKLKYGIEQDMPDGFNTWVSIVIPIAQSLKNDFKS